MKNSFSSPLNGAPRCIPSNFSDDIGEMSKNSLTLPRYLSLFLLVSHAAFAQLDFLDAQYSVAGPDENAKHLDIQYGTGDQSMMVRNSHCISIFIALRGRTSPIKCPGLF